MPGRIIYPVSNDAPQNTEGYMVIKTLVYCASACWLLALAFLGTGCAGLEVGGKVGLYAVDEREEVQTTRSKRRPLRCLWANDVACTGQEGK